MAINPNNLLGQSNPNGTVGVSLGIDPAGANEAFSAGVTSGFVVRPNSPAGMTVKVGGESGVVDSALVRSSAGITFPVGNVSGTAIELAVPAAPSTNSRIDSVVLYVDTSIEATETDGADALGMEIVSGTSASTPVPPTDQQIRAAIEDGASIAYIVIANITVASGATTITQSDIENTNRSTIGADKVDFATYTADEEQIVGKWIDGSNIYRRVFTGTYSHEANKRLNINLMSARNIKAVLRCGGFVAYNPPASGTTINPQNTIPFGEGAGDYAHIYKQGQDGWINLAMMHSLAKTNMPYAVFVEYTKITE